MKTMLIFFLSSLIVFSHCENIPVIGKKKNPSLLKQFNEKTLLVCWIGRYTIIKETKIIDNKDGTIALADVTTQGTDYCLLPLGKTESINAKYYIKKCVQGQVYRSAQNDCKGTGTAANYYGAQKFQWCPTNDRSCEKLDSSGNFVIDETKSPAALTCKSDSFLGKHWSVTPGVSRDFQKFYERSDELPLGIVDFFWATSNYWPVDIQHASALLMNSDTSQSFLKNQFNYVLCSGN